MAADLNFKTPKHMLWALALLACVQAPLALAQGYDEDMDDVIDAEEMSADSRTSKTSGIEKKRKALEKKNDDLVKKKLEKARINEEKKMTSKLQKIFSAEKAESSEVSEAPKMNQTVPANTIVLAPVVEKKEETVEKKIESNEYKQSVSTRPFERIKVIPGLGVLNVNNSNANLDFQSNMNLSLGVDAMITPYVSVGFSMSYAKMTIKDVQALPGFGRFAAPIGFGVTSPRYIDYQHFNLDFNSKLFALADGPFRPYLGIGLGFSRDNMSFNNSDAFTQQWSNQWRLGNERFVRNYFTGALMVGSEISFTERFGMNFEVKGMRALGSNKASGNALTQDQYTLNNLGNSVVNSNFVSIGLGFITTF